MFSIVRSGFIAGAIVLIAVQPGADAALSAFSATVQPLADPLHLMMFNPDRDELAGVFQPSETAPLEMPSWMRFMPPSVALVEPEPVAPALAEQPSVVTPEAVLPATAPEALSSLGTLDKAPPTVVPVAPPQTSLVTPQEQVPAVPPRDFPSRRRAQTGANVQRIRFAGPALTPFAHIRFCMKYQSECRVHKIMFRGGPIEMTTARHQELVRINAQVNRSIIATDMHEPVAQEQWLISPKEGDCNDYAVTKRHELIKRGWPARNLLLAEVVVPWGEHHLVLIVRTSQGDLVADNLNANIRNWTKAPYDWVRVESPSNPTFWSKIEARKPDLVAMAGRDHQF